MTKRYLFTGLFMLLLSTGFTQVTPKDSASIDMEGISIDSTLDYDELFSDLEHFLDSLLRPRSYFAGNISAANGIFHYANATKTRIVTREKLVFSPSIGYYHHSGPGLTIAGNVIYQDDKPLNLYQFSISPSFDFIQQRNWIGGISYIRYFTKDSLAFYVSPLQNDMNAYFVWRDAFIQPGIAASYGWGSRTDYRKRARLIRLLILRRRGVLTTITETEQNITDFTLTASIRHNFYWLELFSKKDYVRFTPMLSLSAGSQKFGFNQVTGTYGTNIRNGANVLYNSGNLNIDRERGFQPLSLSLYLRPEYSIGKFYVQPQLILDYYFPAQEDNLTALFSINAGFIF